jgi:hypothetical protein
MSLAETILAILGTRKLSTSKDYTLLDRRISTLEQNDRMLREILWSTMSPDQKRAFIRQYKEEKQSYAQPRESGGESLIAAAKNVIRWCVIFFGLIFIIWFLFSMIIYIAL